MDEIATEAHQQGDKEQPENRRIKDEWPGELKYWCLDEKTNYSLALVGSRKCRTSPNDIHTFDYLLFDINIR